jgi:hypothetical protein
MNISKILDYLCFLKPAVVPLTYFILYCVQLKMLSEVIDRQIDSATAKIPQVMICPNHEPAKSQITDPGTIFAGDGETAMNSPVSAVSFAQQRSSVGAKTPIPPHPNFTGNMVDSVELNTQKTKHNAV